MGLLDEGVPNRYEHNPMLAVLENYVLDCIDKLEAEKGEKLGAILERTFGGSDWRKTVREQFGLPSDTAVQLRGAWKQRCEEAETMQAEVTPEQFAQEIADDLVADAGG